MRFSFLLLLAFSLNAHADFLKAKCKSKAVLSFNEGTISQGQTTWDMNGQVLLQGDYKSVMKIGDKIWGLTAEDLNGHPLPHLSTLSWGKRLILSGNQIYILRDQGVTAFDLETNQFTWNHDLTDLAGGSPVDLTLDGETIHVILARHYEGGFLGVASLSKSGERLKALPFNVSRSGVLSPDVRAHWKGDSLYFNNGGWMQKVDRKELSGKKALVTKLVPHALTLPQGRRQVSLRGDFFFEGNTFKGCGSVTYEEAGEIKAIHDLFTFPL